MNVGVLASGSGSNLQALVDACVGDAPARVALVVSNREDAGALDRARAAEIPIYHLSDPEDGDALLGAFRNAGVQFVVLAGYLQLVPESVVRAFEGRIINIHPALLPGFGGKGMYGINVHRAVLASGSTISGATVHLVTAEYDRGPILAQWPVPVLPGDTAESLRDRVLAIEHELLPAVVLASAAANRAARLPVKGPGFGAGPVGTVDLSDERS